MAPLTLLVGAVGVLGLAVVVAAGENVVDAPPGTSAMSGIGVLLAAALLAERFPVPILGGGSGGVSLAAVFIVAAGYLYGWETAALIAFVTRATVELAQRRPPARLVYNCATYALCGAAAGLGASVATHGADVRWLLVDTLSATSAFYVANVVLISVVVSCASSTRIDGVLFEAARSTALVFAIMFSVSLMLDVLWGRSPVLSATLLGPLMAIGLYQRSTSRERTAMELALTDPLTGLGNYRAFQAELERLLDDADESGRPLGICVLDLDDFKEINDNHGHQAGDRVLVAVAECLRNDGESFRLGGDEFALLLPGRDEAEALEVGARLVRRIAESQDDRDLATTVSAGVATYPSDGVERSQLVRAADRALYTAKASGRNAVRAFSPALIEFSERRIAAEADRRARLEAASCLARTIEARDVYTGDHSDQVAELAARIALRLGLSAEDAELIRLAGEVHDLGKLAISEEVLAKPGPLNARERRTIETHSEVGYRMLSSLGIEPVADWVRHHHERWDGTGYPGRLSGDEIPIGSRILAVADAYQAMTSERVYQSGVSHDAAIAELRRCAETQFDPGVVAALVEMLDRDAEPDGIVRVA